MEGTFSGLRSGPGAGRGPELAGRGPLGRSSRDVPRAVVLLAEPRAAGGGVGEEGGLGGPMSAAAGRGGRVIIGRKGQKIKGGHGLVAVAARVRQTDGQTWKGNKKGT